MDVLRDADSQASTLASLASLVNAVLKRLRELSGR
jgi:hypothetical protein